MASYGHLPSHCRKRGLWYCLFALVLLLSLKIPSGNECDGHWSKHSHRTVRPDKLHHLAAPPQSARVWILLCIFEYVWRAFDSAQCQPFFLVKWWTLPIGLPSESSWWERHSTDCCAVGMRSNQFMATLCSKNGSGQKSQPYKRSGHREAWLADVTYITFPSS